MSNASVNELKVTAGNNYKNRFQNSSSVNKQEDSEQVNKSIKL